MKVTATRSTDDEKADYMVIDLSAGSDATSYSVRYTNEAPDLTNDTCRTTELWLRRIPAGTFQMGSPKGEIGRWEEENMFETEHTVTITQDFYIGIFECTQKQYNLITGEDPSYYKGDGRPVEAVNYNMIRGSGSKAGAGWPTYGHTVDSSSFMGKLQARTNLTFDLPTEAQWEYACRKKADGTCWTTALNSGKNLTAEGTCANMAEVGRYRYNLSDGKGGYTEHTKVGSYLPSELGLYDMHGNVYEWCLDWYGEWTADAVTDPTGSAMPEDETYRAHIVRSGAWYYEFCDGASGCRAAARNCQYPEWEYFDVGFRIACFPAAN